MSDLRDQLQQALGTAYTLERELGGGGMSRVFVAQDTAFERKIVVKVLPPDTAAAVSVARFKREIHVVARLQHPHIVPVLSAGQVGELPFYTMPFVKGESLRARLQRSGEMSVNEAMHVLRDVAAALAYAHGAGVVHRDIKPDNVIVSGGVAVVTDFGVSKAVNVAATEGDKPSTGITSLGIALGTPAYMAPEQASADTQVDHRADIYSFGCMAYELLAGSGPFAGRSPQQMLAAHVTATPEQLIKRRPNIPPALAALVMRCLEKRAADRPQSADELLTSLDAITMTPSGGTVPTSERLRLPTSSPRWKWVVPAGALFLVLVAGLLWYRSASFAAVTIGATTPVAISVDLPAEPAISPDGKLVAYSATTQAGSRIFVRQMDGGGRAKILTTDVSGDYQYPKWSPDGSRLSFVANGTIFVVPALTGGSPKRTIENAGTHSWSPDGKSIVYATRDLQFIRLQPLDGGAPRTLAKGLSLHSPAISPDGKILLYNEGSMPTLNNVSPNVIWSVPIAGGARTRLSDSIHVNLSPAWMPDQRSLLFVSDMGGARDVYQLPITSAGRPRGKPARLTTGLGSYWINVSGDGSRLVYDVVRNFSNVYFAPFEGGSAKLGAAQPVTRENQHVEIVALSHDGNWIAYDSDRGGNFAIYKQRVAGGEPIQLTTSQANDYGPAWSPDDKEIAFYSTRNGTRDIYLVNADGRGEQQVTSGPSQDYYPDWSPSGSQIVYFVPGPDSATLFTVMREAGGRWSTPKLLARVRASGVSSRAKWSPDGKFIATITDGDVVSYSPDGMSTRVVMDTRRLGVTAVAITWDRYSSVVFASVVARQDEAERDASPRALAGGKIAVYAISVPTGSMHLAVADNPEVRFARAQIAVDHTRLFFTRAAWETNVWMMDLRR